MAQYFNISYDILLDESQMIVTDCQITGEPDAKVLGEENSLREVFVSKHALRYGMADEDYGYTFKSDVKNKDSADIHKRKKARMDAALTASAYETLPIQGDLLAAFFTDSAKKVCGLWFDGAEQFVCPYENLVDLVIRNDGYTIDYDRPPVRGGQRGRRGLVGKLLGGEEPGAPTKFEVSFVYVNAEGIRKHYDFTLITARMYQFFNGVIKKGNDADLAAELTAELTIEYLCALREKVREIRAIGAAIRSGSISAPPLDVSAYAAPAEAAAEETEREVAALHAFVKEQKKKKLIRRLCIAGAIVLALLLIIII